MHVTRVMPSVMPSVMPHVTSHYVTLRRLASPSRRTLDTPSLYHAAPANSALFRTSASRYWKGGKASEQPYHIAAAPGSMLLDRPGGQWYTL